jgi:hypothetical protein
MALDPGAAERIREFLSSRSGISERRMFGGIAFMANGHMAVGLVGGTLMARVGPAGQADALSRPHVRVMDFTGRPMKGYVFVEPAGFESDAELANWVGICLDFVRTLPAKAIKG